MSIQNINFCKLQHQPPPPELPPQPQFDLYLYFSQWIIKFTQFCRKISVAIYSPWCQIFELEMVPVSKNYKYEACPVLCKTIKKIHDSLIYIWVVRQPKTSNISQLSQKNLCQHLLQMMKTTLTLNSAQGLTNT